MSRKNRKKAYGKEKNGTWSSCPECGVKVRPKNLAHHKMQVHATFYQTPKGKASILGVVLACVVVLLLLLASFQLQKDNQGNAGDLSDQNPSWGEGDEANIEKEESNAFKRVVFFETYTSVDCYWCNAEEEPALKRIAQNYGRDEVVILAYHGFYGNDPWETAKGNQRAEYYGGVSGTPSVWVDGILNIAGATGQGVDAMYDVYVDKINQRAPIVTDISIGINGLISGSQAQITVEINNSGNIDASNFNVRFALMEDGLQYNGKTFDWVMRDFLEMSIDIGTFPLELSESFDIDGRWNPENLRAVVWVQDDSDKELQQASYFEFTT